jgi:ribosomal protein S18 acetylase RimI-like enzyme
LDERLQLRKKILTSHEPNCIHLVALVNDKIVGFCDAGPAFTPNEQYRGEIYAIYLLEKYKNAGIGSALFETAKSHLVHKNLLPFVISVLKENHIACRFYEKHGGCYSGEETVEIDNKFYPESVYIFK